MNIGKAGQGIIIPTRTGGALTSLESGGALHGFLVVDDDEDDKEDVDNV
jgi:hypothetical protein